MTMQAKDAQARTGWISTRLPGMEALGAAFMQRSRPRELSYFEAFPFLIAVMAAFLTLSGFVLAVYYNPWHAFTSVQFIARDVNNGWLIRAYHATGATVIFGLAYIHLFRAMLTRSYRAPGEFTWMLSVKLLAVLMLTGWLGYVLTGGAAGQWSLNAAANAALTLGGLPGAAGQWFFGGLAGHGTLARLEVFHVLLGLSLLLLVWLLMAGRRTAPRAPMRPVAFYPYYLAQYFAALAVLALIFAVLAFYAPHLGAGAMNQIPPESLAPPLGAAPPWYLAPIAGLIGVFPGAGAGILAVIIAALLLYALPWLDRAKPAARGRLYRGFVWVLALDVLALGLVTRFACPFSATLAVIFTAWFFFHFLIVTPVVTMLEAE